MNELHFLDVKPHTTEWIMREYGWSYFQYPRIIEINNLDMVIGFIRSKTESTILYMN